MRKKKRHEREEKSLQGAKGCKRKTRMELEEEYVENSISEETKKIIFDYETVRAKAKMN